MIIGEMDEKPVELVEIFSDNPGAPPLVWSFGGKIVKTPAEAMHLIVEASQKSGTPASRMINPGAVKIVYDALINKQRADLVVALDSRIAAMESDQACPPALLAGERAERDRVLALLA